MSRKKRKNSPSSPKEVVSVLKDETKHAIFAVILFALAAFFSLSSIKRAGIAGEYTYSLFDKLFGLGYYLIPAVLVILGISLLKAVKPNFIRGRIIGGLFLLLSLLGVVTLLLRNIEELPGGLLGYAVATPLVSLFDFYISLTFLSAIALISILIVFDTQLTLEGTLFGRHLWKRKDQTGEESADTPLIISGADLNKEISSPVIETATPSPARPEPALPKDESSETNLLSGIIRGRTKSFGEFTPPPLSLLEKDSGKPGVGDIKANANIIKRTLANFGITVEMDEISIGPSVTRYALKPAEGVKLSRIVGLQNDLALALAAHPIRIEAPIPGKSLVGIEIPNTTKSTVGLASLLGLKDFADSTHPLLVALGKGVSGMSHFANLAKAPHLLIAGATGSGKSVTIHALITSLLYRNPPDRMRFIMIDPKRVELTLYNKIPHLLTPVLTDAKKAIAALRWAAKEMDRRYNILEAESVRDVQSYHKNVLEKTKDNDEIERMPYIVIIIDELADIMSAYPRELEAAIVRLAQMSRAVGIHLVVSTQRPSVEVITGLIKANIPSRIALQVASQIDSRTIIDMAGAEKLLGAGDMLYLSGEMSKPIRLQSAFITEDEVKKVVGHLSSQYANEVPDEIILEEQSNATLFSSALDGTDGDDDDLYEEAREAVLQAGKASASYLQRKLKVGYARAARLLDMLEERGVIGPGEGAKPREVFLPTSQGGGARTDATSDPYEGETYS